MGIDLSDIDDVVEALAELEADAENRAERAMTEIGFSVMKQAKIKAPVVTGFLQGSGEVIVDDNKVTWAFRAEYALYVHENVEQSGKGDPRPNAPGAFWDNGEPKYLTKAIDEVLTDSFLEDVAKRRLIEGE